MTNTYRFTHEMISLLKLATRGRTGEITNSTHNSLKVEKKPYAKTSSCPKNYDKMKTESDAFRTSSWPWKEVQVLKWAKWRICHKFPFISSWLMGAGGGGEPKSALMCNEASANHTWPLPSTHANEWWPLGAICCSAPLKSQLQYSSVLDTTTQTHLCEDMRCPHECTMSWKACS